MKRKFFKNRFLSDKTRCSTVSTPQKQLNPLWTFRNTIRPQLLFDVSSSNIYPFTFHLSWETFIIFSSRKQRQFEWYLLHIELDWKAATSVYLAPKVGHAKRRWFSDSYSMKCSRRLVLPSHVCAWTFCGFYHLKSQRERTNKKSINVTQSSGGKTAFSLFKLGCMQAQLEKKPHGISFFLTCIFLSLFSSPAFLHRAIIDEN